MTHNPCTAHGERPPRWPQRRLGGPLALEGWKGARKLRRARMGAGRHGARHLMGRTPDPWTPRGGSRTATSWRRGHGWIRIHILAITLVRTRSRTGGRSDGTLEAFSRPSQGASRGGGGGRGRREGGMGKLRRKVNHPPSIIPPSRVREASRIFSLVAIFLYSSRPRRWL